MECINSRRWLVVVATIALGIAGANLAGCRRGGDVAGQAAADTSANGEQEIWESLFLEKAKIGYSHTTVRPTVRDGRRLIETDSQSRLKLKRFGQSAEQELKISTLETPEGRLLSFKTTAALGPTPLVMTGRVEGNELVVETTGAPQASRIAWTHGTGGFRAIEQSLEDRPLAPGEARTLRMLVPLVNQVAEVELVAHQVESTALLGQDARLLRIESTTRLPDGNMIQETLWTDPEGRAIKRRMEAMQQESYRTTRAVAVAESTAAAFDLGTDTVVKLDRPLADAHHTKRVRYRVELAAGDPRTIFAAGPTQSVRSLGPHTAELTVERFDASEPAADSEPIAKEYTAGNSVLQIDDPRVRAMAQEAKDGAKTPAEIAVALERYVHRAVETKNFSQTFATAAEVAESREGDCTEHAVLLAALLRACGVPSRVAIGLVYVPRSQGFGYHMWTEAQENGRWMPLDATLGQGGIGAAHIKIADSSLHGASAYSTFLPVAQVVGQLKIRVLEVE